MYKKHPPRKMKEIGFADPTLFNVSTMLKIQERCLKIRVTDTIKKKISPPVEMAE
jgi:hypothetical protein